MTAYYNENDPKAAAWLRELIKAGAIAPGEVDDRSILDVTPAELAGFTQCHFFAGIGVWSYSLRLAGWADSRSIWTGSCPCQPFSAAGKGGGFDDERHLWPYWFHLIEQCRPAVIAGEQVASKNADSWIDLVHDDLEALGYAFGAVPFPAAGIGAPHIRDRTYWLADATAGGWREERADNGRNAARDRTQGFAAGPVPSRGDSGMAHADGGNASAERQQRSGQHGQQPEDSGFGWMAHADSTESEQFARPGARPGEAPGGRSCDQSNGRSVLAEGQPAAGPINGFWRHADWLHCRDIKWRPVEPGTFPLAHGAPARVGRLRGYGNAIVAEAAAEFIRAFA